MNSDFDIVNVGGGAAGIAAAMRLTSAGRSVLLLEAASRLGGRAWTHRIRGLDLDMGCGWLHSAERNAWASIAGTAQLPLDQRKPAWGKQYRDLGFSPEDQAQARRSFDQWLQRMAKSPPASDRSADALDPACSWNPYIRAIAGFISGAALEDLSIADYVAYEESSTDENWRVPTGLGSLIARSFPMTQCARLSTAVESITWNAHGIALATSAGDVRARAAILTVSTQVLTSGAIKLPPVAAPWLDAASQLPLGRNEKLFLEIVNGPFVDETQLYGNPKDARTAAYYIRPMGLPVIECFFGGESASVVEVEGPAAGFAFAVDQLAALFGSDVRQSLRPLVASNWGRSDYAGGAYSYARPGHATARAALARSCEDKLFFAGEATSQGDFSTAHGAHDSGVRAAEEALAALQRADHRHPSPEPRYIPAAEQAAPGSAGRVEPTCADDKLRTFMQPALRTLRIQCMEVIREITHRGLEPRPSAQAGQRPAALIPRR